MAPRPSAPLAGYMSARLDVCQWSPVPGENVILLDITVETRQVTGPLEHTIRREYTELIALEQELLRTRHLAKVSLRGLDVHARRTVDCSPLTQALAHRPSHMCVCAGAAGASRSDHPHSLSCLRYGGVFAFGARVSIARHRPDRDREVDVACDRAGDAAPLRAIGGEAKQGDLEQRVLEEFRRGGEMVMEAVTRGMEWPWQLRV